MIPGLERLVHRIEAGALTEAQVYAAERHRPGSVRRPPGVLECPICGRRAIRFEPFGLLNRRQARCPHCGSLERHRFLWHFLNRRTDLMTGRHRVLHTAPEPCLEDRLRPRRNLRYRSVDRFDPKADLRADLSDLPLPTASIDVLITSHVLEHVQDDRRAMAELGRVVRPGGWAVVMVPFDPRLPESPEDPANDTPAKRLAAYGHPYHYRIYGADLVDRLRAAGFAPVVHDSRRLLSGHQRRRYRINRNHLLWCRRVAA